MPKKDIIRLADACVQCGLCLPHCPTYQDQGQENRSPRGRIALMKAYANGQLTDDAHWAQNVDSCLNCGACEQKCPAGVQYHRLFELTRAERVQQKSWRLPFKIRCFNLTVTHAWLARFVRPFQKWLGLKPYAPANSPAILANPSQTCKPVGLLYDCSHRLLGADNFEAAIFVLKSLGFNPQLLKQPSCCGAWWSHIGQASKGVSAKEQLKKAKTQQKVEAVVSLASSCCFGNDSVSDIYDFILSHWTAASNSLTPVNESVYLQTPCTQKRLKNPDAVKKLLQKIPGLKLIPFPMNGNCCGAGGSASLLYGPLKNSLINQSISGYLATNNPSCAQQLCRQHPGLIPISPIAIVAKALKTSGKA